MTKDEIEKLKALEHKLTAPPPWTSVRDLPVLAQACNALPRLLEERERLLGALKLSYDEKSCWAHDVAGIAYAAIAFAEASPEEQAPT